MFKFISSGNTENTTTYTNINLVEEITFGNDTTNGDFVNYKIKDKDVKRLYMETNEVMYNYLKSLCTE